MPTAKSSPSTSHPHPADRRRRASDAAAVSETEDAGLLSSNVTFRLRRLEPLVSWVLAGYTLWVGVLLNAEGTSSWLLAFYAFCVGAWSQKFPARVQGSMLLRGVLLLVGAGVLHFAPGLGGATGAYFFWPCLIAVFYALLLARPWAILLIALAMLEFGLACALAQPATPWFPALVYTAFLLLFPSLAIVFGRSMRESDQRSESSMRDERTLLYNETGFFVHGGVLLAECHKQERPFSMVLLNGADLHDASALLERKVANDLFAQVVQGIAEVPGEGIAARTDAVEFALLLPGVNAERAASLVQQRLGHPPKVEVALEGKPVTIVLELAIAQPRDKAQSLEELYDTLHARWSRVSAADRSVRTKPMPLLDPDSGTHDDGARRAGAPTIPLPLAKPQKTPWQR